MTEKCRKNCENITCRQTVVLQDLTEDQFVRVKGEWIPEHADWNEEHVTVGAFGLVCTRAVEVPLWDI